MLAQQLVAAGETVLDVPPALSARVRLLDNARSGWIGESAETFGVDVMVVELSEKVRSEIHQAQVRQTMVNPSADPT